MAKYLNNSFFNESILPDHLNVSTISLSFQMNTIVNIDDVAKEVQLNPNGICSIDYKGNLNTLNDKKKKKKRKENNFYNSITIEIMGCSDKSINFKIFKNGGVQAAGCKSMVDGDRAIQTLVNTLNPKYVTEPIRITDLKINLINVNFKLKFCVNREKLHKILLEECIPCAYEKCKHAGVKIEFVPENKESPISIFIFESGSIVITGSKNEQHILSGYNYITNLIKTHRESIFKIPYETLLENARKSSFKHLITGT